MQYRYLRVAAPNSQSHQRQTVNQELIHALKSAPDPRKQQGISAAILRLLQDKHHPQQAGILDWIYSYGSTELIHTLIDSGLNQGIDGLDELSRDQLLHWLPNDHEIPEIQQVRYRTPTRHTLICLATNSQRLNMSVRIFHYLIGRHFDQVIYLRDVQNHLFTRGTAGFGNSIEGLRDELLQKLHNPGQLIVLGASGGAYAAASFLLSVRVSKVVLFSPNWLYQQRPALSQPLRVSSERLRLYFAARNRRDQEYLPAWSQAVGNEVIERLDSDDHGSLQALLQQQGVNELMAWMKN